MKNAPDGGVFYFSRITFLQPHRDCLLDTSLNADGTGDIPEVLRPYMGGKEKLVPKK